jgi:hypothetical protein
MDFVQKFAKRKDKYLTQYYLGCLHHINKAMHLLYHLVVYSYIQSTKPFKQIHFNSRSFLYVIKLRQSYHNYHMID